MTATDVAARGLGRGIYFGNYFCIFIGLYIPAKVCLLCRRFMYLNYLVSNS
jgi:hypothetical protein